MDALKLATTRLTSSEVSTCLSGDRNTLVALAQNPYLDYETFISLSRRTLPEVLLPLLDNPMTSAEVHLSAVRHAMDDEVVNAYATRSPFEVVHNALSGDECIMTREVLASSAYLSEGMQEHLAQDGEDDVPLALAKNPLVNRSAQWTLANHENPEVRAALAANPGVTSEAREHLSQDEDVLAALKANPSTSTTEQTD